MLPLWEENLQCRTPVALRLNVVGVFRRAPARCTVTNLQRVHPVVHVRSSIAGRWKQGLEVHSNRTRPSSKHTVPEKMRSISREPDANGHCDAHKVIYGA